MTTVPRRYRLTGGRESQRGSRKPVDAVKLSPHEKKKTAAHKEKLDHCLALARTTIKNMNLEEAVVFAVRYEPVSWRKTFWLHLRRAIRERTLDQSKRTVAARDAGTGECPRSSM